MHYSRFKVHGTPQGPGRRQQPPVCVTDGCAARPVARDLCKRHYYATKRAAERAERVPPPPKPVALCAVDECGEVVKSRGWCGKHYQRWRRFGAPDFMPPSHDKRCVVEGCDGVTNARGLCGRHYYRWQTYGDPLISKNKPRSQEPVRKHAPRECATCGHLFDPGASSARKYCGRGCRPTRASVGVNKRSTVERLARIHGWFCYLCFADIDPAAYWPNTKAGSVDHVLAVHNGGTDDIDNLGLACLGCNLAKGTS